MRIEGLSRAALIVATLAAAPLAAHEPGTGRWAAANDPVAKRLIELERQWADNACVPNTVLATLIAEDFVGTSPDGGLYTKADMLPKPGAKPQAPTERNCKLLSARVRYYGPDVAVVYGKESAIVKGADGKDKPRTLIWTDTFLRRGGKWQIIAVQDMDAPPK